MQTPATYPDIVMRHGQSEANAAHLIASQRATAETRFGLTALGRTQARDTARTIAHLYPGVPCVVVASPLLRTRQTAAIVRQTLGCKVPLIIAPDFVERDFGAFELQSDTHYKDVWFYDERGQRVSRHFNNKVEELASVQRRSQRAFARIKARYPKHMIVIVTHGDVASNMIATDKGEPLARHRQVGGLPTAGYYALHDHTRLRP